VLLKKFKNDSVIFYDVEGSEIGVTWEDQEDVDRQNGTVMFCSSDFCKLGRAWFNIGEGNWDEEWKCKEHGSCSFPKMTVLSTSWTTSTNLLFAIAN